jgi:ABC-type uncharacterized transport system substrate-binding protein
VSALMSPPESSPVAQASVTAFLQALSGFGWVEGKNIRIDYRFAAGDPTLFKTYAAELVGLSPDAILTGSSAAVAALQQQTRTIPIVFTGLGDPVGQGFVQSLARPGGNITGFGANDPTLMGKWLQLLKEVAPRVMRVGVILNPDTALFAPLFNREIEAAAPSLGITVALALVRDDAGIEEAIAAQASEPGAGLIFCRTLSTLHIVMRSSPQLPVTVCLLSAHSSGRESAVCWAIGSTESTCTRRRHPISTASSKAPVRPISRFSSRRNTRWSLTSRPPRPLASPFPPACSTLPTR